MPRTPPPRIYTERPSVPLSPEQLALITRAAKASPARTRATWMRETLLRAAERAVRRKNKTLADMGKE